jgi:hypothetical protein
MLVPISCCLSALLPASHSHKLTCLLCTSGLSKSCWPPQHGSTFLRRARSADLLLAGHPIAAVPSSLVRRRPTQWTTCSSRKRQSLPCTPVPHLRTPIPSRLPEHHTSLHPLLATPFVPFAVARCRVPTGAPRRESVLQAVQALAALTSLRLPPPVSAASQRLAESAPSPATGRLRRRAHSDRHVHGSVRHIPRPPIHRRPPLHLPC